MKTHVGEIRNRNGRAWPLLGRVWQIVGLLGAGMLVQPGYADYISVGSTTARPGGKAQVPVSASASADLAGANAALVFDPGVFLAPTVSYGGLLTPSHVLSSNSPVAGQFHVVAKGFLRTVAFTGRAGTVFNLSLDVSSAVPPGTIYPIRFAPPGPGNVAASGLSNLSGNALAHVLSSGYIAITENAPVQASNVSK
ncbi:hypothetical protein FJY63_15310, partial [Candidatus Sumerlaeota bacterium]|nr:hypothetical protein [Candidatus Sumerlaeota bacterium]